MVQRLFFEATRNRYEGLCTYACLFREAGHGQVVRTSFIHSWTASVDSAINVVLGVTRDIAIRPKFISRIRTSILRHL